uniref:PH01B001G05.18 protein n=1 Tax=Phyllostachys edulis TaxID=38705 RepID=L0P1Y6_PHYED|nr:PH01B001G05.18 [Phyllostachys edulis]
MAGEGIAIGKAPLFDGSNYTYWKIRMLIYLKAVSPSIWKIVNEGYIMPLNPLAPTNQEAHNAHLDAQAMNAFFGALNADEFNRMYSGLNNIVNELKGLGTDLLDVDIVRKMLRALPDKYETLVTLFLNSPELPRMTPTGLLGNLITNELFKKDKEELLESSSSKKKITAFKAKAESRDDEDEEEDSDEEFALLVRRMKKFMKRHPHRSFNSDKNKKGQSSSGNNRYSNIRCYNYEEKGHIASHCPEKKDDKGKSFKKKEYSGKKKLFKKIHKDGKNEAHIGEWDSNDESSDSDSDEDESPKKKGLVGIAIKEAPSLFSTPTCLIAKGEKVKSINNNEPTYDELMDMLGDLNEYLGKEKSKYKVLNREHISLKDSYEELKEARNLLIQENSGKSCSSIGITCDIIDDMPSIEIAKISASISCNNPIALPCCSSINVNHDNVEHNNAKLVENNELKEQVTKLSKSLKRCFKGKATLDKLLSEQICSFNKEGLGYVPKKGKKLVNKPTRFVRQNGKYCHKCREIGHLQQACPMGKTPSLGIYDSYYMLRKTKDGKVNYKTGGKHWMLDSGCTQHMTSDRKMFTIFKNEKGVDKITFGDNSKGKVFFLDNKGETSGIFKSFAKRAQNEFDFKIKKIHSDNGSKFKNTKVKDFCDEFRINYSSNSKAYHVFNKNSGLVEERHDVQFDETNGSQEEHENLNDVGDEGLTKTMEYMRIGDIKPEDNPSSSIQVESI